MLGKQSFFEIINQTAKQAVGNAGGVDSQAAKLLDAFSENGILNQNSSDFSITACYDENGSFTGVELTSSKVGTLIEKPKNTVYSQEVVSVVDKNVTNSSGDSSGSTKENNAEINKNKEGAVVAAAQVVAEILPERQELIVEAEIKNTDIGFVEPGQEADIKIDTYNYQKYGRLQGKVAYISPDAIENERGEQTYRAEIAVAGDSLPGTELSPGRQCSVEVKTDRRRVIAFFLEPLADALDHSLKVR